jgi:hypothetical protein
MKVWVTIEMNINDDCHADYAARAVDAGLIKFTESSHVFHDDDLLLHSWQIVKVLPESLDTL